MKLVTIVGARPQFIKLAPVSRAFRDTGIHEVVVHTGQHYDQDMSDLFFDELELFPPDHHLGVGPGSHGRQTAQMLEAAEKVLLQEEPDWVLVYGDTNSTLASALAAAKLNIPIAHIEAGARSFNRRMPEEINRVVTDHVSSLLLASSAASVANLRREGFPDSIVEYVGDVMYDTLLLFSAKAERLSTIIGRLGLRSEGYALATIHRAENTDDPSRLAAIFQGLTALARDLPVVLPLHPRTRSTLDARSEDTFVAAGGVLMPPVGYLDMLSLQRHAALVVTDSGGVQKEAFFHRVPCVTLREETEWTELVELGWNVLVPPAKAHTLSYQAAKLRGKRGIEGAPYGNGNSSQLVVECLVAASDER